MKKRWGPYLIVLAIGLAVLFFFSRAWSGNYRWEHQDARFETMEEVIEASNQLGEEGWELVALNAEYALWEGVVPEVKAYVAIYKKRSQVE